MIDFTCLCAALSGVVLRAEVWQNI